MKSVCCMKAEREDTFPVDPDVIGWPSDDQTGKPLLSFKPPQMGFNIVFPFNPPRPPCMPDIQKPPPPPPTPSSPLGETVSSLANCIVSAHHTSVSDLTRNLMGGARALPPVTSSAAASSTFGVDVALQSGRSHASQERRMEIK
ncbi:unnamed protein product [Pleuronectes platessa]|uniref:Uncharacterized protein n=1 Tax=Pleuronectes platessa TaxID=8262 RepID=A0A9N7ZDP5_PLEPL|nr:unnamed protein product [Pleuronectes platessa]